MNFFREGPMGPGSVRSCVTLVAAAVLLVAALACAVPGVAFASGGGSVSLGVSVKSGQDAGTTGSVELGVKAGALQLPAPSGNEVMLGINVKAAEMHQINFVGYYCDEQGNVIEEGGVQKKETIEVQRVRQGDAVTVPANLERSDAASGTEYWVDGWYAYVPDGRGGVAIEHVDLATYQATSDATIFCYWKKGYVIRLDPNNGTGADGGAVFDGTVGDEATSSGYVAIERDVAFEETSDTGSPDGYDPAEHVFPQAQRPGYVFKGWYWGAEDDPRDAYGRVPLADADAEPIVAVDNAGMGYDFFRDSCTEGTGDSARIVPKTLYAKWELAPCMQISLEDAAGSGADVWVSLWFWPGRGYAFERPVADKEIEPSFVVARGDVPDAGLDVTDRLHIAYNPTPAYSTQVFSGWGYATQGPGGGLEPVELISCQRSSGGNAGADAGSFVYLMSPRVLDYVDDDINWTGPVDAGGTKTEWVALFDTAQISVSAPFQVTFQKKGASYDTGATDVEPYAPDELERDLGWTWVESIEQPFTNKSSVSQDAGSVPVSVYVSGIECVDMGASSLFPSSDGAADKRVFGLYEMAVLGGGAGGNARPTDATMISFGYADDRGANKVVVDARDPSKWIKLPPAAAGGISKKLYFGLDLTKVTLNRSAIALGGTGSGSSSDGSAAGASSYVASLANVKYTYSVVP